MFYKLRLIAVLSLFATVTLLSGCRSGGASMTGRVKVPESTYTVGQSVRFDIEASRGSVGTDFIIQRKVGDEWMEWGQYNPRKSCPEKKKRPEGGYLLITKRGPMCRYVDDVWSVDWAGMNLRQCRAAVPADPGIYRICAHFYAGDCLIREGVFGFEIPRPTDRRRLVCSSSFTVK